MVRALALLSRLETPYEKACRLLISDEILMAVLRIVQNLQLFEKWEKSGMKEAKLDELAKISGADAGLLGEM